MSRASPGISRRIPPSFAFSLWLFVFRYSALGFRFSPVQGESGERKSDKRIARAEKREKDTSGTAR